jgi:hypothetical protein
VRLFFASAALVAVVGLTSEADAFCRSTTCTGDCPRDPDGCKTTGQPLQWATSCVGISLQEDSSIHIPMKYFRQVVARSLIAWSDLACEGGPATIAFSQLDDVSCRQSEYNEGDPNANVILFQDTKWEYTSPDNNVAKTTVSFDPDSGEILDADIEINHAFNNFTISDTEIVYDLESVLTHEVGHLIGIDHSPDFTATMYASYQPETIEQRTLEIDDIEAACASYPPTREAACDPEPEGGLGSECIQVQEEEGCSTSPRGGAAGRAAPLALALGLLAAGRLSSRRLLARVRRRV